MENRRASILLIGFFIGGLGLAIRHVHLATYARDKLLAESGAMAWRQVTMPAPRGRILAHDEQPLAWTERHYDLWLEQVPESPSRRQRLAATLAASGVAAPTTAMVPGTCLRRHLDPAAVAALEAALIRHPELQVKTRSRRVTVDYPEIRRQLGEVSDTGSGISGWEQRHDRTLRGQDGMFMVMRDRQGNWLPGTWREIMPMRPGKDVVINAGLAELRSGTELPEEARP